MSRTLPPFAEPTTGLPPAAGALEASAATSRPASTRIRALRISFPLSVVDVPRHRTTPSQHALGREERVLELALHARASGAVWIALISEQNRGFDTPHARSRARSRSCSAPLVRQTGAMEL